MHDHSEEDIERASFYSKKRMCLLEYADTQNELAERAEHAPIAPKTFFLKKNFGGK